jgi:hypothetical protein
MLLIEEFCIRDHRMIDFMCINQKMLKASKQAIILFSMYYLARFKSLCRLDYGVPD